MEGKIGEPLRDLGVGPPKSSNRILLQDRFVKTKLQEENEETIFQKYAIIEQQSEKDFSDLVSAWTTWIARVTFHNNI